MLVIVSLPTFRLTVQPVMADVPVLLTVTMPV
jgi:hypothetical protein